MSQEYREEGTECSLFALTAIICVSYVVSSLSIKRYNHHELKGIVNLAAKPLVQICKLIKQRDT